MKIIISWMCLLWMNTKRNQRNEVLAGSKRRGGGLRGGTLQQRSPPFLLQKCPVMQSSCLRTLFDCRSLKAGPERKASNNTCSFLRLFINFLLSLHLPSFLSSVSGVVNLRRASRFLSSSSWWQRWAINSSKSSRVFQLAAVWEDTHTHGDDCDESVIGAFYHH